jgi:hypothetical protein
MSDREEIYSQKLGNLVSDQGRFIGYVFLVLGAALLCFMSLAFIPVLTFAGFVLVNSKGVKINFKSGVYKEYRSWMGIETGSWKVMPAFSHVSVFRTVMKTRLEGRSGVGVNFSDYVYKLKLVDPKMKEGVLVFSSSDKDLALKKAEFLSGKLNITISDNSNPPVKTAASATRRR